MSVTTSIFFPDLAGVVVNRVTRIYQACPEHISCYQEKKQACSKHKLFQEYINLVLNE